MAALPQTSRVKFMDDLEGHFCYLDFLLKSNSNASTHPVSEEQSKQNICRERKIFVKAALQLLDAQEKNVVNSLIVPSLIAADNDFEIIRSGYLKKGTRVSKMIPNMGLSHSKSSYTWKTKYVELRHGEFSYYDETVEETPLMTASLHSYHSQSHSKGGPHAANTGGGGPPGPGGVAGAPLTSFKKSIPLSPDLCSCRVVQYANGRGPPYPSHQSTSERDERDGIEERDFPLPVVPTTPSSDSHFVPSHAFELCLLGGQRRLFLTGSAEESREWVKDILTAMVGGKSLTLEPPPSDRKPSIPAEASAKSVSTTARMKMQEGGAGPYAGAITEYLNLQARLHAVREEEGYKSIMRELVDRRARVVVPVAYIKGKCSDNSFLGASAHLSAPTVYTHHHDHLLPSSLSINALLSGKHRHHTGNKSHTKNVPPVAAPHGPAASKGALAAVCVERSQMWKDLQRDEVCVNGECVAGASSDGFPVGNVSHGDVTEVSQGAEAIVGLLVRHIADAVDKAKAELQSMLLKSQPHTPHASHHVLLQVMTEAQIVQCARSVLMMCNRTQSGGDTYYCVDTLLRRKSAAESEGHNNNLFILAPMSNKADPLTIEVDLVETDRSGFDPEGGGSRLQMQQKAAAFATPMGGGPNNTSILLDHSPRTDFIDALAATSLNSNGQASPAVLRTGTTDTADGDVLKRRSSRRMHLKLSIDEDVDFYEKERSSSFSLYADAATPLAAVKVLRSEFVSILEENSSHNSDTTDDRNQYPHRRTHDGNLTVSLSSDSRSEDGPGGRSLLAAPSQEDGPPLRVLSIDEGALHDESGDVDINGSSNNTPPYLISGRDDSTVISDITFDTTAAFSQHTTVASYHQQTRDVALGCAADPELTEMASPSRPGKKSHHLKGGKALMKMISSRTKHTLGFTPGGNHAHNFSDQDLHASATAAAASMGDDAPGTAPTDLRPSYASFGSLQTMTPGRSRNGSSADGASNNNSNNTGGGGNMLSSLFKSERNKTANKTNNASELAQSADATRGGMRNGEKEREAGAEKYGERAAAAEKKACVCVRLRVRGVSRYRVCSADPQGDPAEDNWAAMEGAFSQTFFVPAAVEGDFPALSAEEEAAAQTYGPLPASAMVLAAPVPAALSRLAMTDRVVVISALKCES